MNIILKKILCPIDFSNNSFLALRYAIAFAAGDSASIVLLHVVSPPVATLPGEVGMLNMPLSGLQEALDISNKRLNTIAKDIQTQVREVECAVLNGTPYIEICCYAMRNEIDLIVMGSQGRSRLSHFLIGSVTEQVLRKSPCPVLTVKDRDRALLERGKLECECDSDI